MLTGEPVGEIKHRPWTWIPAGLFLAACASNGPGSGSAHVSEGPRTLGDCPPETDEVAADAPRAPVDPDDSAVAPDDAGSDRDLLVLCEIVVTGGPWPTKPQGLAALRAFLDKVKLEHERLLMADVPPPQDILAEIEALEQELKKAIASQKPVQPDTTAPRPMPARPLPRTATNPKSR